MKILLVTALLALAHWLTKDTYIVILKQDLDDTQEALDELRNLDWMKEQAD